MTDHDRRTKQPGLGKATPRKPVSRNNDAPGKATKAQIGLRGSIIRNPEQREEQRRQILTAAGKVFARKSYVGATMDDIAAEMQGSKGVLYYQFQSKQELIVETRRATSGAAAERLESIFAQDAPVETRMELALRDLIAANFHELSRHVILTPVTIGLDETHAVDVRDIERRSERVIIELLKEGIASGVFIACNTNVTAFTLIRACLSPAWWYKPGQGATQNEIEDTVAELLMRGIRTPATD